MSFQAFGKDIDVMSEDYVIEWDKDFADDLNVDASDLLQHTPTKTPTIYTQKTW